jgi:hypothetical protein
MTASLFFIRTIDQPTPIFALQTAYSEVIARLDRAIQYPETVLAFARRHGVLVAPLSRGMTMEEHESAFPRRDAPGLCKKSFAPENRGRRESRVLSKHPQPRMQNEISIRA